MIYIYLKKKFLFIIIIMSARDLPIKYTDFDVTRLVITPFQEAKKKGKDGKKGIGIGLITWPRYNHPKLNSNEIPIIRCPNIIMDSYGIPRESEYFPTPLKRSVVKIPLDESKPGIKKLIKKLKEIDAHILSNINLLLGKKANIYKNNYCPLYNDPCNTQYDDDNEDNVTKPVFKLPFIRVKLNLDPDSGDIKSKLSINEIINNIEEPVEVHGTKSIDDFAKVLCYRCELKPEIELTKLWAQASTMPNPKWGVGVKLIKGLIKPSAKNNSKASQNYEDSAFINSDDDNNDNDDDNNDNDDNCNKNDTKSVNKTSLKKIAQVNSDDSDDSDDEVKPHVKSTKTAKNTPLKKANSDDDSDEEAKAITPAKNTKSSKSVESSNPTKAVKKEDSDDDSDEVKPAKKEDSDDDSDDDSGEEVKPPPAKNTKPSKPTKVVKKDDSDDDSDEEVKPPPAKPAKNTKPSKVVKPKAVTKSQVKQIDTDDSDE